MEASINAESDGPFRQTRGPDLGDQVTGHRLIAIAATRSLHCARQIWFSRAHRLSERFWKLPASYFFDGAFFATGRPRDGAVVSHCP